MRVLICGNSQAAALLRVVREDVAQLSPDLDISFYMTIGGTGPYLFPADGKLIEIGKIDDRWSAQCLPEGVADEPIASFEAIVISALGYVDGGASYDPLILRQGLLHRFKPKKNEVVSAPVSEACFRLSFDGTLDRFAGSILLNHLRQAGYTGRILIQPFPLPSADLADNEAWHLRRVYDDFLGAHRFLCSEKWRYLQSLCAANDAELLSYPPEALVDGMFTAPEFSSGGDHLHTTAAYGELVLHQIAAALRLSRT